VRLQLAGCKVGLLRGGVSFFVSELQKTQKLAKYRPNFSSGRDWMLQNSIVWYLDFDWTLE